MIEFRNVRKVFPGKVAVDDVSFTISNPQMIGIVGRSGAGKSTLLRIINRLTSATSGEIIVEGRDVLKLDGPARRAWQQACAMIFQQFNLVPRLDVLTNVMLGRLNSHGTVASLLKAFSATDRARALMALEKLGIVETALQRAEELSGGQQQRVAIARAMVQGPTMLLADEPIASLDPLNAKIVMDALREFHDRDNLTVIANLHTLDTARNYCDRIIGMRAGRIVFDGGPAALTTDAAKEIYGAGDEFDEATTSTSLSRPETSYRPTLGIGKAADDLTGAAAVTI